MRKYLPHAIAAACLLALIFTASHYVRKYQSEIDALQARINDAEAERVSLSQEAAIARQRATAAANQAALISGEERVKRERLEADNRALRNQVNQSETERRKLAEQLAEEAAVIPTLDDVTLAAETVRILETAYPAQVFISPSGAGFEADRPAVETALEAGQEVLSLRQLINLQNGELTSLHGIAANLDEALGSALRERDAQQQAAESAQAEAARQLAVSDSCARQLELWRQKDQAVAKRNLWSHLKPGWQISAGPVLCHDGVVRVGVMAGIGWRF